MSKLSTFEKERLANNVIENHNALEQLKLQPCADCRLRHHPAVMTLDHIGRTAKTYGSIGAIKQWNPELFRRELKKCSVVCMNCHYVREMKRNLEDPKWSKYNRDWYLEMLEGCIGSLLPIKAEETS